MCVSSKGRLQRVKPAGCNAGNSGPSLCLIAMLAPYSIPVTEICCGFSLHHNFHINFTEKLQRVSDIKQHPVVLHTGQNQTGKCFHSVIQSVGLEQLSRAHSQSDAVNCCPLPGKSGCLDNNDGSPQQRGPQNTRWLLTSVFIQTWQTLNNFPAPRILALSLSISTNYPAISDTVPATAIA